MENIDLVKLKDELEEWQRLYEDPADKENHAFFTALISAIEQLEAVQRERDELTYKDYLTWHAAACKFRTERDEARAELARRDAAAGEQFIYDQSQRDILKQICIEKLLDNLNGSSELLMDDIHAVTMAIISAGFRQRTAAQPAVLPPEITSNSEAQRLLDSLFHGEGASSKEIAIEVWSACLADAKALDCQPVPVVMLPARFKPKVSSLLGNHAAVMQCTPDGGWVNLNVMKSALDAAGIKWEVEHEASD